ncbi:MAG: phosphoribosylamine--glycine ligase [Acidimicrobiia bacterium]|nr:phosphoribosylamine--glycine ligase [Acidimicrobiia bacterium]
MRVLLIGSGGREHAIGWKLAQSDSVGELLVLPGNPGLAELGTTIEGVAPTDVGAVAVLARQQKVDLVVVGPEAPLAAGVGDALRSAGIPVFGPNRAGARLESSKAYAKEIMTEAGVATGHAEVFVESGRAVDYLRALQGPYVVKADGLAAGKGVLVTQDLAAAEEWVHYCIDGGFGDAGVEVVIEEYLDGPEVSVFAICDGTTAVGLEPARDYKRLGAGDAGPNTGGMGCYSPVADLPAGLVQHTLDHVVAPVLTTMAARGIPYSGFLYTGFVLTEDGPKVLEFNCRLGDPETQVVLPRMETDLARLLAAAAAGAVATEQIEWSSRAAVDVVLAAHGYPSDPRYGDAIRGVRAAEASGDVLVFHAGTARDGKGLVTAGGRVLNVVGLGESVADARTTAYEAANLISFKGKTLRTDVAASA